MENWSETILKSIDSKLEGKRDKDLLFMRIAEFKRNVERVGEFSNSCPHCLKMQIDIREAAEKIDEVVDVPGKSRRHYDRLISRLAKHMQKEHGFFAPYYFSYVYALFGLIGGGALGFLLYLAKPEHKIEMFSIGISIGLVVSYVLGSLKDRKIRDQKKLM